MIKDKGAAGFVIDGEIRNYEGTPETSLPVWRAGLCPNSPYSNGHARVGLGAGVVGRHVSSSDIIVADINGVVVVPFGQFDGVITQLATIHAAEAALDEEVQNGFYETPAIEAMIRNGRAVLFRD